MRCYSAVAIGAYDGFCVVVGLVGVSFGKTDAIDDLFGSLATAQFGGYRQCSLVFVWPIIVDVVALYLFSVGSIRCGEVGCCKIKFDDIAHIMQETSDTYVLLVDRLGGVLADGECDSGDLVHMCLESWWYMIVVIDCLDGWH